METYKKLSIKLDIQLLMSAGVVFFSIMNRAENSPWPVVRSVISSDPACSSQVHTSVIRPPCRAVREHLEPQEESSQRLT